MPISGLLVSSSNTPEVRLLSSSGITRLLPSYEPVRHPRRPSRAPTEGWSLTEFSLRAATSHRWGFPCFDDLLFQACRRHYPDGTAGCCRCLAQQQRPSPKLSRVGFRHKCLFEAGHRPQGGPAFTHVSACLFARSPKVTFTQSTSTNSLPPSSLWLLAAERPIGRVGFAPTGDRRLARRTGLLTGVAR